jgi:hypothetical protein
MAEVYEVGATPVEVSQNIGVQRASCYRWSLWSGYDPPTRGESEYWGSTYIVPSPSQGPLPDDSQHSQQTSTWRHTTLTTDLYLTTHNTHNRPLPDDTQHSQQTATWRHTTLITDKYPCLPVGFEATIPENKRPQINPLEGAAAAVGALTHLIFKT